MYNVEVKKTPDSAITDDSSITNLFNSAYEGLFFIRSRLASVQEFTPKGRDLIVIEAQKPP